MENSSVFQHLYHRFSKPILTVILKRTGGDLEIAQAVVQDTFIAAYNSFHTFKHKSSYFTWLCKISLNKLTDYYRQQVHYRSKIIVPTLDQINSFVDPNLSPEEKLSLDELRQSVNASLDLLPHNYRQLLHLKYYQHLSTADICVKLQITPRQLEGRLYRARTKMAQIFASLYPTLKP